MSSPRCSTPRRLQTRCHQKNCQPVTAKRGTQKANQNALRSFCKHPSSAGRLMKWRATKAQAPEGSCPLPRVLTPAHAAPGEGCESSRDGNHMLASPPGKSPTCKPAGRPPTNYMCTSARWVSVTFLRSKKEGGRKVPTLWKEPDTCHV